MLRIASFLVAMGLCSCSMMIGCSNSASPQEKPAVEAPATEVENTARDGSTGAVTDAPAVVEKPAVQEKEGKEKEPDKPKKRVFGGKRPATLQLPEGYDPSKPLPLLIVLHGFGASGSVQAGYMAFPELQEKEKFLLIAPDGTVHPVAKRRFWNATDACCGFGQSKVDDVAYLTSLIKEIKAEYKVDAKRVYLVGHSNGGFMSYRMACDASDQITAIVSLAGATYKSKILCNPKQKVSILQVHGTDDSTIRFGGGANFGVLYPGAEESVLLWGSYNECSGRLETANTRLELDSKVAGPDTNVQEIGGCPKGVSVALWTIEKGSHIPGLSLSFAQQTWSWLMKHSKP